MAPILFIMTIVVCIAIKSLVNKITQTRVAMEEEPEKKIAWAA